MSTPTEGAPQGASQKRARIVSALALTVATVFVSLSAIASVEREIAPETDDDIVTQIQTVRSQEAASAASRQLEGLLEPRIGLAAHRFSFPVVSNPVLMAEIRNMSRAQRPPEQLTVATLALFRDAAPFGDVPVNRAPKTVEAPKKRGQAHWQCMAEAIYFEARSESARAQRAVGEVIMNRVDSRRYPDTICEVVNQGAHRKHRCQFSYNCDGMPEKIHEPGAWRLAKSIAKDIVKDDARPLTKGATHYHATSVYPHWARHLTRTARYGSHIFYREGTRISRR